MWEILGAFFHFNMIIKSIKLEAKEYEIFLQTKVNKVKLHIMALHHFNYEKGCKLIIMAHP